MAETLAPYPLRWPPGWDREQNPQRSRFEVRSLAIEVREVHRQLELMGATSIVVNSNAVVTREGLMAARQPYIEDCGVVAYFTLDGTQHAIPCDRWDRLQDNVRAIAKSVDALRGLDRWGAKSIVRAAFRGFEALPHGGGDEWWQVLEVSPDATNKEAQAAYRRLVKATHPDVAGPGGEAAFRRITKAMQDFMALNRA